jgi:hypothetical protein
VPPLFQQLLSQLETQFSPTALTGSVWVGPIPPYYGFEPQRILMLFNQDVNGLKTKCSVLTDNIYVSNLKIDCLIESWLNNTISSHKVFPALYSEFHADRNYLNCLTTNHEGGTLFKLSK